MNDAETVRTTGLVHQSLGCCPELMARLRGFNANLIRRCPGAFGYEDSTSIPLLAEEGWRDSAGVVSSAETFRRSSIEASPYRARASRHPVCAFGASTPARRGI